jgi:hypothetical protein
MRQRAYRRLQGDERRSLLLVRATDLFAIRCRRLARPRCQLRNVRRPHGILKA